MVYWSDWSKSKKIMILKTSGNKTELPVTGVSPYVFSLSPDYLYFRDAIKK